MGSRFSRTLIAALLSLAANSAFAAPIAPDRGVTKLDITIEKGPFEPTWSSIGSGFQCPEWFRDAKFGIWAHWGPQSAGQDGDWYAHFMYYPDTPGRNGRENAYDAHLKMFGHPTQFGYKDVLPYWKAENFDPEKLMALYKRAGARFFMAMGAHHDNFDCWNSTYQPWNSVRIGPHKDIVALWRAAADKEGLRFGVSFHADYSWWWYQPAFQSDTTGPLAGKPYDAAQHLDGKGTFWEGLDLKDLYGKDMSAEYVPGLDPRKDFYSAVPEELKLPEDIEFAKWYSQKWLNRAKELVDKFHPDMIYLDGNTYPFSGIKTGRGIKTDATVQLVAHQFNTSAKLHDGKNDSLVVLKGSIDDSHARIPEFEGKFPDTLQPGPFLSDNAMGDWFYRPGCVYDTKTTLRELVEVVSRNGTLLINVMLKPDGTLDEGGEKVLNEMGDWMAINGEAIFDTRPWKTFGEGTVRLPNGFIAQKQIDTKFTAADIRFTSKGNTLYAMCMEIPTAPVTIKSLAAKDADKPVADVIVLGTDEKISWQQTADGLVIQPLAKAPCQFMYVYKIAFKE